MSAGCSTTWRCSRSRIPRRRGRARSPPTSLWYPRLRADADVLHCPTFRGPFRAAAAARRHRARPRRAAPPGVVQPLDAHLLPARRAAGRRRSAPRYRRLGVHQARARRAARRPRREDQGRPERGRGRLHARGPRAEGDYVLAVGTLEPRKNLARIAQRRRRRAARRRRARLGRRRAAARTSPGSATSRTRSWPRSTAARAASSTPRSTRDSASRCRGARVRLPGGDEPRLGDGRARR